MPPPKKPRRRPPAKRRPAKKPKPKAAKGDVLDPEPRQPWERQPGESAKAFDQFVIYRELGPSRSIAKVGRAGGKAGATSHLEDLSAKHDWPKRAAGWDAALDIERQEAEREAVREMAERQAKAAQSAHILAIRSIAVWHATIEAWEAAAREAQAQKHPPPPFPLSIKDTTRLLAISQQLERQARGEPDVTVGGGVRPATDPVVRAIISDPAFQEVSRELIRAAARARESLPSGPRPRPQ